MRRASLHMLLCQFAMALGLLLSLGSEAWAARPALQAAVDLKRRPPWPRTPASTSSTRNST